MHTVTFNLFFMVLSSELSALASKDAAESFRGVH